MGKTVENREKEKKQARVQLTECYNGFRFNPSDENYQKLESAMSIYQKVKMESKKI